MDKIPGLFGPEHKQSVVLDPILQLAPCGGNLTFLPMSCSEQKMFVLHPLTGTSADLHLAMHCGQVG
jgi:hypothetical protein